MNFLFLIAIFLILILAAFLAQRFKVHEDTKPVLLSVVLTGTFFSLISVLYRFLGVESFAPAELSGLYIARLPLEQLLFCFTLPYTVLVIYLYLKNTYGIGATDKYSLSVSNVVMGLCIAMIFFAYSKWYTLITSSILLLLLFYIEYINKIRFMLQFYRALLMALVLFLLIFIPLNALNVVSHTASQTIELNIAYIPFESYFGFFELSLLSIFLLERFKRKS